MDTLTRLFLRDWHWRLRTFSITLTLLAILSGVLGIGYFATAYLLLLIALAYPSRLFYEWNRNTSLLTEYLLLPIPWWKKWLARWLQITVLIPALILTLTALAQQIRTALHGEPFEFFTPENIRYFLQTWYVLSGILLVGGMFFRKAPFLKTMIFILLFLLITGLIAKLLIPYPDTLLSETLPAHWGFLVQIFKHTIVVLVTLALGLEDLPQWTLHTLLWGSITWLWLISLTRLREMQAL